MAPKCIQLIILWLPWQLLCQAQMVSSFHSINAVGGLLFQEEIQNENWHQLLAIILSLRLGIHLLCSYFADLQLAGGTCTSSRCLVCIPAVIQPTASCSCVRLNSSQAKLSPSLMLWVTTQKKELHDLMISIYFLVHTQVRNWD